MYLIYDFINSAQKLDYLNKYQEKVINRTITQWLSQITKDGTDRFKIFANIFKVLQGSTTILVAHV